MITISDKSRWAIRALTELALRGDAGPVPILDVAERRGVPPHLLEQLFSALRKAGVLQSQRGVRGGYSFRRDPGEVTVLNVVEAVDGPVGPTDEAGAGCDVVWNDVRDRVVSALAEVSVADMAEREARLADAPMFHI